MTKAAADDARRQQMKKKTLSVSGWFLGPIILKIMILMSVLLS